MGFRFHKSIRIFPGVRLNFSKSGVSTTIGRPGANVNIRGRRVRGTVGLPESGMSYSKEIALPLGEPDAQPAQLPRRTLGAQSIGRLIGRLFGR